MLTREQIIQSFVAKADAQYLEYCKIPLDDPNHSWAYDSAEYRATLEQKFVHPVYKVCSDFYYLDLTCCLEGGGAIGIDERLMNSAQQTRR